MTYTVHGSNGPLGRLACHRAATEVLVEICTMQKAGFRDVQVQAPYLPPEPAAEFLARQASLRDAACDTCARECRGSYAA